MLSTMPLAHVFSLGAILTAPAAVPPPPARAAAPRGRMHSLEGHAVGVPKRGSPTMFSTMPLAHVFSLGAIWTAPAAVQVPPARCPPGSRRCTYRCSRRRSRRRSRRCSWTCVPGDVPERAAPERGSRRCSWGAAERRTPPATAVPPPRRAERCPRSGRDDAHLQVFPAAFPATFPAACVRGRRLNAPRSRAAAGAHCVLEGGALRSRGRRLKNKVGQC